MNKLLLTLVAVAFTATGIAAKVDPAETACRQKAIDTHKAAVETQKKTQAHCKTLKPGLEKSQCNAGMVKALKEAAQSRDAALKACKPARK